MSDWLRLAALECDKIEWILILQMSTFGISLFSDKSFQWDFLFQETASFTQRSATHCSLQYWRLWRKVRSLRLWGKHFTIWAWGRPILMNTNQSFMTEPGFLQYFCIYYFNCFVLHASRIHYVDHFFFWKLSIYVTYMLVPPIDQISLNA